MKFNSALCMNNRCLTCDILCIKFAISSKVDKDKISAEKLTTAENIDIKLVNAKNFS